LKRITGVISLNDGRMRRVEARTVKERNDVEV